MPCLNGLSEEIKYLEIRNKNISYIFDKLYNPSRFESKSKLVPSLFGGGESLSFDKAGRKNLINAMLELQGECFDNKFVSWVFATMSKTGLIL